MLESLKVTHHLSTPLNFSPPFRANVQETYKRRCDFSSLKKVVEANAKKKRPILNGLLNLRHKIVKRFGFKTEWDPSSEYGPFDVSFIHDNKLKAQYEDPHFSFYAELENSENELILHCGVHYKTPQGMIYFWAIYPFHVTIFKNLLNDLSKGA